jgi:hypothetical protein
MRHADATSALSNDRPQDEIITGQNKLHKLLVVQSIVLVLVEVPDNVFAVPLSQMDYIVFSEEYVYFLTRHPFILVSVDSTEVSVGLKDFNCSKSLPLAFYVKF